MSRVNYKQYIDSKEWRTRRAKFFEKHDKKCRRCGKGRIDLQLHHHTYVRLGEELDSDLVPLCGGCHQLVHQFHKDNPHKTLSTATREIIRQHPNHSDEPIVRIGATSKASRVVVRKGEKQIPPPGWITLQRTADILGVDAEVIPKPKRRKYQGFFFEATVRQWANQRPPKWLKVERRRIRDNENWAHKKYPWID